MKIAIHRSKIEYRDTVGEMIWQLHFSQPSNHDSLVWTLNPYVTNAFLNFLHFSVSFTSSLQSQHCSEPSNPILVVSSPIRSV